MNEGRAEGDGDWGRDELALVASWVVGLAVQVGFPWLCVMDAALSVVTFFGSQPSDGDASRSARALLLATSVGAAAWIVQWYLVRYQTRVASRSRVGHAFLVLGAIVVVFTGTLWWGSVGAQ